jgi:hypothetical protein|tara:strand:+ start:128 stop:997 length:870 start_codon:yes stop_codon:yes gene_type:complete
MLFNRIFDNKLHVVGEVDNLGFDESEGLRIPDKYLENKEFVICRGAQGIGDWGVISAMPRLLKEKYPDCKVKIPSSKMIQNLFGVESNISELIFSNNPYVDFFVDFYEDEIYHDHYRIYDKENIDVPLIKQMLKFWQFEENEMEDCRPEMYWSDEEKEFGDEIIKQVVGDDEFGGLLLSNRFGTQYGKHDEKTLKNETTKIIKVLKENPLPYFYWTFKPIGETPFFFTKTALDMRNMDLRIQLYIRSRAKLNVGNQCGTLQTISRYSKLYTVQRQFPIAHNYVDGEIYL